MRLEKWRKDGRNICITLSWRNWLFRRVTEEFHKLPSCRWAGEDNKALTNKTSNMPKWEMLNRVKAETFDGEHTDKQVD